MFCERETVEKICVYTMAQRVNERNMIRTGYYVETRESLSLSVSLAYFLVRLVLSVNKHKNANK